MLLMLILALKNDLADKTILQHLDFSKGFLLRVDAASNSVAACLIQKNDNGEEYPIAFACKFLTQTQQNYATVEKECFAIVFGLERFREYLDGSSFSIQTDNSAITYLQTMRNHNSRLMRWSWKLQEWCPHNRHIKGRDNVMSDF